MPILIDGTEVVRQDPSKPLGEDEQQILDALHGRGALGEKLKKDLEREKDKARHKIELQFLKARSHRREVSNLFNIQVWESGRRLHGGGDQRMVFCGYWPGQGYTGAEECGKPISDGHFGVNHLVCPHCNREQFLDEQTKLAHIALAKKEGHDIRGLTRLPIVNPLLVGKLSSQKLAILLAKIFRDLGSNADIYVKFHPTDIRCRDVPEVKKPDLYEKARRDRTDRKENRGLVNYPLANIIKDVSAGATLEKRLQMLLLS